MTMTVGAWWIPTLLTIGIWSWVLTRNLGPRGGDYNFGPAIMGSVYGAIGIIASLVVWLVYFMIKAW